MRLRHLPRRALAAATHPVIEHLEDRRLLSSIAGTPAATAGSPYTLTLDNAGLTAPVTRTFTWGDGTTSSSPTHTYLAPGTYAPKATVTDANGAHPAQPLGLDPAFGAGAGTRIDANLAPGEAHAVLVQHTTPGDPAGDRLLVGGWSGGENGAPQFTVARYLPDGTPDATFGQAVNPASPAVRTGWAHAAFTNQWGMGAALALDSQGRILLAGGNPTHPAFDLARFTADGRLDTTFGAPDGNGAHTGTVETVLLDWADATALAVGPDDSVYVGGGASLDSTGQPQYAVARYTPAGQLDTAWGTRVAPGASTRTGYVLTPFEGYFDVGTAVALRPDGRLVIGGWALWPVSWNFGLARYTTSGDLDTSFGPDGTGLVRTRFNANQQSYANAIALQFDGRILAVGKTTLWDPAIAANRDRFAVERFTPDGLPDATIGGVGEDAGQVTVDFPTAAGAPAGDATANAVAVQPDGRIWVAGTATDHGRRVFALARLNAADGSLDGSFGSGGTITTGIGPGDATAYALAATANGGAVLAGTAAADGNADHRRFTLARYLPDNTVAVTAAAGTGALLAPALLITSAGTGGALVHLAWSAPAGAPAGTTYAVYRSTLSGFSVADATPLATGLSTTTFDDATADNGTTYYYRVVATDPATGASSPASNLAFYTTAGQAHDQLRGGGFETPRVGHTNATANPAGGPWTFTGGGAGNDNALVASNGSWLGLQPDAPEGTQAVLLERNARASQTLLFTGGDYALSYQAAQRQRPTDTSHEDVVVTVDGVAIPATAFYPATTAYAPHTTPKFAIPSGTHTIAIAGLNSDGGYNAAWLDDVQLLRPPVITGTYPAEASTNEPLSAVVATFRPAGTDQDPAHYNVSIGWAGGTGPASILPVGDGTLAIFANRSFAAAGTYGGTLTVTHAPSGLSATTAVSAAVTAPPGLSPTATGPAAVDEGATYTLTLDAHPDAGAAAVTSWSVNWGDGSPPEGVAGDPGSATHVFANGTRACTVTATAYVGGTPYPATPLTVSVADVPTRVRVAGQTSIYRSQTYALELIWRDDGPADAVSTWTVNWGDGSAPQTVPGTLNRAGHVFHTNAALAAETFTVTAVAHGNEGDYPATPITVTVRDRAPVIVPVSWQSTPPTVIDPLGSTTVPFPQTYAVDPDGDLVTYVSATAEHGTVDVFNGHFYYTPAAGFSGHDVVHYAATDGALTSAPDGLAFVTVASHPPTAGGDVELYPVGFVRPLPGGPNAYDPAGIDAVPVGPGGDGFAIVWDSIASNAATTPRPARSPRTAAAATSATTRRPSRSTTCTRRRATARSTACGCPVTRSSRAPPDTPAEGDILVQYDPLPWGGNAAGGSIGEGGTITYTDPAGPGAILASPDYPSGSAAEELTVHLLTQDGGNAKAGQHTVQVNADGTWSYTAPRDFVGWDWFTYYVTDAEGHSSGYRTAEIYVGPNDPTVVVSTGFNATFSSVSLDDGDADGDGVPNFQESSFDPITTGYAGVRIGMADMFAFGGFLPAASLTLTYRHTGTGDVRVFERRDTPSIDPEGPETIEYVKVLGGGATSFTIHPDENGYFEVPSLYVQGVSGSSAPNDVVFDLTYDPGGSAAADGGSPPSPDAFTAHASTTVAPRFVGIDSANELGVAVPPASSVAKLGKDDATKPGKIIAANTSDRDGDGIPDFADGYDYDGKAGNPDDAPPTAAQGAHFVPMVVSLPAGADPATTTFQFTYDASDPLKVTVSGKGTDADPFVYAPAAGHLRIWKKDAWQARDVTTPDCGGDFVDTAYQPRGLVPTEYTAAQLGFTASKRTVTLYVEAVRTTAGSGGIRIQVSAADAGPSQVRVSDAVRVSATDFKIRMDLNGDGKLDAADDTRKQDTVKQLVVDNTDTDGDFIPGLADGFSNSRFSGAPHATSAGLHFSKLEVRLPAGTDRNVALLRFTYADSDPSGLRTTEGAPDAKGNATPPSRALYTPAPTSDGALGELRIWTADGGVSRNARQVVAGGGDYVPANVTVPFWMLNPAVDGTGDLVATLYVEAVGLDASYGATVDIKVDAAIDGVTFDRSDIVHVKTIYNKPEWQEFTKRDAGFDDSTWAPTTGYNQGNLDDLSAIYNEYKKIFLRNPAKYLWAGGAHVAAGMVFTTLDIIENGAQSPYIPYATLAQLVGANRLPVTLPALKPVSVEWMTIGKLIFDDIAWQFWAYDQGGINEIDRLAGQGQVPVGGRVGTYNVKNAWHEIDAATAVGIAKGFKTLVDHEQRVVVVNEYLKISSLPIPANAVSMATLLTFCSRFRQPVPGMMTFYDWASRQPLAVKDITNTTQRGDYMDSVLVPYWSAGLTAADRLYFGTLSIRQLMDLPNLP